MDINEIAALLHIHKEAGAHGGYLKNIADAAQKRLKQIDDEMTADSLTTQPPEPEEPPAEEPPVEGEGEDHVGEEDE